MTLNIFLFFKKKIKIKCYYHKAVSRKSRGNKLSWRYWQRVGVIWDFVFTQRSKQYFSIDILCEPSANQQIFDYNGLLFNYFP